MFEWAYCLIQLNVLKKEGRVLKIIDKGNTMSVTARFANVLFVSLLLLSFSLNAGIEIDAGYEAVMEVQQTASSAKYDKEQGAIDLVDEFAAAKDYKTEPKKSVYFARAEASRNVSLADPNFLNIRELIATEAILSAKADIIVSRMTSASAEEWIELAGPSIQAQLEEVVAVQKNAQIKLDAQLESLQKEASALIEGLDDALAQEAMGITWNDRGKRLLDAIIQKLDESYDSSAILEDKRKRVENLKTRRDAVIQRADELVLARKELERQVREIRGDGSDKSGSRFAIESKMPLFGATVVFQAEYFDEYENFSVAVLVAWSPLLEGEARGILLRDGRIEPRPTKLSLDEWLDKQNLATMVGPRRYLSKDGSDNFLGIAAAEYNKRNLSTRRRAELSATLSAQRMAALSLTSEVEVNRAKDQQGINNNISEDRTELRYYEELSERVSQSIEKVKVAGLEKRKVIRAVHPSTGKDIIVVVANINSAMAVQSVELMADTYALLRELNIDQSYLSGQTAGMREAAELGKNNSDAFEQGRSEGTGSVVAKTEANQAELSEPPKQGAEDGAAQAEKSKTGAWMGDTDVDDPF